MVRYSFVVPIEPGKTDLVKRFEIENSTHTKEHDEFYKAAGILGEQSWIQLAPKGNSQGFQDVEIVNLDVEDPVKMFIDLSTSNLPWAVKFRQFAKEAYGIDMESSQYMPPLNEIVVDWKDEIE
jgi:hypothetical protein